MAVTAATNYRDLVQEIRAHERRLAYGSHTVLWDEYCERMETLTGVLPYRIDAEIGVDYDALVVPAAESAWWRAAYAYMEEHPSADRDQICRAADYA